MPHQPPPESRITLLFEKFSSFVEDYASNLAMGGMFLHTEDLRPVGSIIDFEIKLHDGFQLVRGLGEVIWVRPRRQGAEPPSGLAVRFQALDDKGRELILKIMEEQVKSGGRPFDLDAVPDGALSEPGSGLSMEVEPESPVAAAAPLLPLAPRPDPADVEAKILGEDGFTLTDAEGPPVASPTSDGAAFQELEFDAPWGEELPEVPLEVLEEDVESEVTPPGAAAPVPAVEPSPAVDPSTVGAAGVLDEALPGAVDPEPLFASENAAAVLEVGSQDDATLDLDDSFVLAQEAAEEMVATSSPESAGEIDFDDIDFSVPAAEGGEAQSLELQPADAAVEVEFDSAFELEVPDPPSTFLEEDAFREEEVFLVEEPSLEEDATLVGTRNAVEEDEPTILTSGALPAPPAPAVTNEPSPLPTPAARQPTSPPPTPSLFSEPAADRPATAWSATARPAAAPPAAALAPPIREPASARGPTTEADEDDLFTEEADAGHVLRQALTGSKTPIAAAVLLVLLVGAAYFFRARVGELLGFAVPASDSAEQIAASVAADLSPDAARPADIQPEADSPVAEPPPTGSPPAEPSSGEAPSPEAAGMAAEVEVADSPPPVIVVSAQPETPPTGPGSESALAAAPVPSSHLAAGASRSTAPATRVDHISWRQSEGGTLVTVELDGELGDDRYVHSRLSYNPTREMVEIVGIGEPYVSGRIEVGSSEVLQIRVGHHVEPTGNEIHVVLDFPDASPGVAEVRNLGDRLEILVVR